MTTDTNKDPETRVEEGLAIADDKSDAGSATTAPSVESGDSVEASAKGATSASPRWKLMGGAAALLVTAGIVTAVVLTTSCDKKKNKNIMSSTLIDLGGEDEAVPYDGTPLNFDPPFGHVELPLFGKDVLEPYSTREALEEDLTKAAKNMANKIILQNVHYQSFGYNGYYDEEQEMSDVLVEVAVPIASASAKQTAQQKVKKAASTNNQEKDADEADYLKTDGTYVYAAYGDYLVVWDMQGELVTSEQIPVPEQPERQGEHDDWGGVDDMFIGEFYDFGMTYAYIESIQLTDKHVLAVVGGLGGYDDDSVGFGAKGTHVRVYNKPTDGRSTLELVATRDIHGFYIDSKYLEATNSIHIVTGGDFNTYGGLAGALEPYMIGADAATPAEYYRRATKLAADKLIPEFVTKMADFFVQGNNGQMPTMMKVNSWLLEQEEPKTAFDPQEHYYGYYDEAFRAYVQITSIADEQVPTTLIEAPLEVSTTAFMGPSTWGYVYATEDSIVVNMGRYDWDEESQHQDETLFLFHLKVDPQDKSVSFYSTASLSGHLPSKTSIDIQGSDLRVATTLQKWAPLDNVWPVCGDSWYFDSECMNENNWNDCFDVALNCRNVVKTGCPYTFECADDESDAPVESSTDNYVIVFDISEPGDMTELGRVRIGEPHEVILGVHFGETFSYANTFDQRDPFYVLKLEQGQAPVIAGELKLDGFSSYLQPISEDGSLVVGIGQSVTGEAMEQRNNGVLVTVFDVSDPSAPKALASEMLADPDKDESYSDAEWDSRAVQYNDGTLVIPVTMYPKYNFDGDNNVNNSVNGSEETLEEWNEEEWLENTPPPFFGLSSEYHGFVVLDVSSVAEQGIKEVARIDHSNKQGCTFCDGRVSYSRSFLFDDKTLMTVRDSRVQSTDLSTGAQLWSLNITVGGKEACCY